MTITPLGDRVVVEPLIQSDISAGGIFLPETVKERPQEGRVIATATPTLKLNDRVLYSKFAGSDVTIDGVPYLILSERDVLAVVA